MASFGFSSYYVKDMRGRNHLIGAEGTFVQSPLMAVRYGMSKEDAQELCAGLNMQSLAKGEERRYRVIKLDTGRIPEADGLPGLYKAMSEAILSAEKVRRDRVFDLSKQEAQA